MADKLLQAGKRLARALSELQFGPPVTHVYNPLDYAWAPYADYLTRYGQGPKRVVFLGMNPGPFGMAQTGIPFGEIQAVTQWLGVSGRVLAPRVQHPKRPVTGFGCLRSEVSGQRLWGLFASRYGTPNRFFQEHFVLNYCPLAFMEESGKNRTPDKLSTVERTRLFDLCDAHLAAAIRVLNPDWVIGVGDFAAARAAEALEGFELKRGKIPHPSPASPAANRDWAGNATRALVQLGVWS